MIATLRRFMALLLVVQWLERDLAGKPGPTFPDHAQKPGIRRGPRPQKGSPAKRPGTPYALRRNIVRKRQKTMVCLAFGSLIFALKSLWEPAHRPFSGSG